MWNIIYKVGLPLLYDSVKKENFNFKKDFGFCSLTFRSYNLTNFN